MDQQVNEDVVLSAIRRGEDSLPKLRAATGLEYAQLHPLLYSLEYDDGEIVRKETPTGFARYVTKENCQTERIRMDPIGTQQAIPPAAFRQSAMGMVAREMSLLQRDAPHCAACHGLCFLNGRNKEGRIQWSCRTCNEVFDGSTLMGRIDPSAEPEPMRERDTLGPEEEAAIESMREEEPDPVEPQERVIIELAEDEADEPAPTPKPNRDLCGCGYAANHRGRCRDGLLKHSRQSPGYVDSGTKFGVSVKAEIRKIVMLMPPGSETDTPRLYDALVEIHPALKTHPLQAELRTYIAQGVRPLKPELLEVVEKGRAGAADTLRRVSKNGTNPKTETAKPERVQGVKPDKIPDKKYGPFCEANCFPDTKLGHHKDCAYWKEEEARRSAIARNGVRDEEPKTSNAPDSTSAATANNGQDLTADFLFKVIEQKEAQITVLQDDIAALRRTADILSR